MLMMKVKTCFHLIIVRFSNIVVSMSHDRRYLKQTGTWDPGLALPGQNKMFNS